MENLVNIERLSDLLSIPSVTYDEWDMVEYLSEYFDKKGYEYGIDSYGNIFVTKGTDVIKPLICAHIDTVHKKTKINIKEEWLPRLSCYGQVYPYDENVLCLKGYDDNGEETGCGGDDKCGVYVCFEILDRVDNVLNESHPQFVILFWDSDCSDVDEYILDATQINELRESYRKNLIEVCTRIHKYSKF
jgi:hypothetical protein